MGNQDRRTSRFHRSGRFRKSAPFVEPVVAHSPSNALCRITGEHLGSGYLVGIDACRCEVHQSQFDYLLELTLAAYKPRSSPYLFWWDTECTQGDPGLTRQVARRLRAELGCPLLIHNNKKGGYCLTVHPSRIELCDSLWELPPQLVSRDLLAALRTAHDEFWVRRGAAYNNTHSSHVVAQPSRAASIDGLTM